MLNLTQRVCAGFFAAILLLPTVAHAAPAKKDFKAKAFRTEVITLTPGEEKTIPIKFKNTGVAQWGNMGEAYVSLYTAQPYYRTSIFEHKNWRANGQATILNESAVKKNQTGTFFITLKAPLTVGTYKESFALAAEDLTWIPGGTVSLTINVQGNAPVVSEKKEIILTPPPPPQGTVVTYSPKKIEGVGGSTARVRVLIRNTGKKTWEQREIKFAPPAHDALFTPQEIVASSWFDSNTPLKTAEHLINTSNVDTLTFSLTLPYTTGNYKLTFSLSADGTPVEGTAFSIPVTVTQNAPAETTHKQPMGQEKSGTEPLIRVGLFKPTEPLTFISASPYTLKNEKGEILLLLAPDTPLIISPGIALGMLNVTNHNNHTESYPQPLRLESTEGDPRALFNISSMERRVSWNKSLNFNKFRGVLELRRAEKNNVLWAINELPLESYMKGLAETSDNQPEEFLKALATAARTYAYYHIQSGMDNGRSVSSNKHEGRSFHVDATYDQVYWGAERETAFPRVNAATEATRGMIITYQGDIAISPYYTQSNGTTKSWEEVWGGTKHPWLQSVEAHYDKGKKMLGHGVGMSLQDAIQRAKNEGASYKDLLTYYYQGVTISKKY